MPADRPATGPSDGSRRSAANSRSGGARRSGSLLLIAILPLLGPSACSEEPAPDAEAAEPGVVIGFVGGSSPAAASALEGARLGTAEAAHAGRLVDWSVTLLSVEAHSPREARAAARRLAERGTVALVGGFDEETCRELSEFAEQEGTVYLNVGCRADGLRRRSRRGTFHVEASDSMYAESASGAGDTTVLWHPRLSRYGAGQLIERFERRGIPPDGEAWAGWMAVKMVWESVLEAGADGEGDLASLLGARAAVFDGHKGEPLRIDPSTGQLAQPLYRVARADLSTRPAATRTARPGTRTSSVAVAAGVYALVSNEGSEDISVIDVETLREVSRIHVGGRPRGISADPAGPRALVALSDDAPRAESDLDAIAVIDLRRGEVVARHAAGSDPEQFALSPDGSRLYAANEDAGTASITDLAAGVVRATLIVGIEPEGVAVSPDGRWVYVTAETSNTVSVIDTQLNEVVSNFLVDARPRGVAFSPTAARAYVTNEISGTVSVVDTDAHRSIATIELDPDGRAKPVGVVVSPDGRWVYVANGHAHSIAIIDAETSTVVAEIPVGRRPWGIEVSRDGSRVFTANGGSDDVSVVDVAARRVVGTIPVGSRPWGVAIAEVPPPR